MPSKEILEKAVDMELNVLYKDFAHKNSYKKVAHWWAFCLSCNIFRQGNIIKNTLNWRMNSLLPVQRTVPRICTDSPTLPSMHDCCGLIGKPSVVLWSSVDVCANELMAISSSFVYYPFSRQNAKTGSSLKADNSSYCT